MKKTSFESLNNKGSDNLFKEFFYFIKHQKKYWLIPIVLAFLLIGLLVFLSTSPSSPFIYTLF